MPVAALTRHKPKMCVALALTLAAGVVDIVSLLRFASVFTAHMTGNTVHLADALLTRKPSVGSAVIGMVIALFFFGSVVGRLLLEAAVRFAVRRVASCTLLLECSFIAACILLRGHPITATGILAFAMGLQTATLTRIGPLTVHTTFVTGMLNKLAQLTSHVVFHSLEAQRSTGRNREAHRHARREKGQSALFLLAIWICYLGGALAGTALDRRYGPFALLLPCLLLLSAVAVDQLDPLAVEEEADESER